MNLRQTVCFAISLMLCWSGLTTECTAQPLRTNTTSFRIPFEVESPNGSDAPGTAILFVSVNGGPFEQVQRVSTQAGGFEFTAPADGRYAFAVRLTDAGGNLAGPGGTLQPELEVIVDTTAPQLDLQLTEISAGLVNVSWRSDSPITPGSLRIEYAEGDNGRWNAVAGATQATGSAQLQTSPRTSVSVRGFLTDLAGNEGTGSAQLILSPVSTRSDPRTTPAVTPGPATATANRPADSSQQSSSGAIGPNPFQSQPSTGLTISQPAAAAPSPGFAGLPAPGPTSVQAASPGFPAAVPPQTPVFPTAASTGSAPQPIAQPPMAPPQNTPFYGQSTASSAPFAAQASSYTAVGGNQIVKNRVFDIAYQVEDVGPSGVSAVELFVTENSGQQWFRYGKDVDLKSPFQVDTRGEGTFGFTVRVYNGLGFSAPPPQPGEPPEIVVTVDQTPPVVRLGQPQIQTTGQGQISLAWQVSDTHPAAAPVRLEYATSPSGPWTPLFDWQPDQQGYQFAIQPGIPGTMYFRLLARDAAGNVSTAQTPQPLIIDQHRPRARLLSIQPASFQSSF